MSAAGPMPNRDSEAAPRILVVRLGAMGDIIHALPAVAALKSALPGSRLTWAVESRWAPLLDGNPSIDRVAPVRRGTPAGLFESCRGLRRERYDFAVDFQGLIKSAVLASIAAPDRIFGFDYTQVRERLAAMFYTRTVLSSSVHVVDRNFDLASGVAGAGHRLSWPAPAFPLPAGVPEGNLPPTGFVLASPLAGWRAKQWPMGHYGLLAGRLKQEFGIPLVLNGPPGSAFPAMEGTLAHFSGLAGLIDATRRAAAVVGVDSGPMHLAAALERPGIAIFGPTDPARNGPYGGSMAVLRHAEAVTTYKRGAEIDESMRRVAPDEVFEALRPMLRECVPGCRVP
jgi:heptosyltransferase I